MYIMIPNARMIPHLKCQGILIAKGPVQRNPAETSLVGSRNRPGCFPVTYAYIVKNSQVYEQNSKGYLSLLHDDEQLVFKQTSKGIIKVLTREGPIGESPIVATSSRRIKGSMNIQQVRVGKVGQRRRYDKNK